MILNLLLFLIFFMPPIIDNSYITTFSLGVIIIFSYFIAKKSIYLYLVNIVFIIFVILFLSFISIYNTVLSNDFSTIWSFKDIIRPIFLFLLYLFIMNNNNNIFKIQDKLKKFFLFFLLVEGVLSALYFIDRNLVTFLNYYNNFSDIAVERYWRFIGLFGNPNFDGMILGYGLIFLLILKEYQIIRKIFWVLFPLNVLSFLLAGSRSAFVAFLFALFIYFIFSKRKTNILIFTFLLISIISYFLVNNEILKELVFYRINSSFDYANNDRIMVVLSYVNYFKNNFINFLLGNMAYVNKEFNFTDNDYILYILKYGFISLILFILLYFHIGYIGYKLYKINVKEIKAFGIFLITIVPYNLIIAIPSVPFSMPKFFIFTMLLYFVGLKIYKNYKIRDCYEFNKYTKT